MADSRLSDLSAAASVGSTDLLYTVQTPGVGGVKATVQQLTTALTGSTTINGTTVTTSQPVLNLSQTWNAGAITFTGLKFNVTDTTSASGSLLEDLQVGGVSKFSVDKTGITTIAAGAAATPALTTTGDTNTGVWFPAADTVAISTGGSERMRLDASGNLGLGVTPSTWSQGKAIQFGATSMLWDDASDSTRLLSNTYYNSGWKYLTTQGASFYQQNSGVHYWHSAPSGTAGNAITFTQVLAIEKDKSLALQGATSQTGAGITFPATQVASSDVNTLDDYEEGTWNAVISNGTNNATMSRTLCQYTKIGRQVTVSGYISTSSMGSVSGNLRIIGLPFTCGNGDSYTSAVSAGYGAGLSLTAGVNVAGYVQQNSTYIGLTLWSAVSGASNMNNANWGAAGELIFLTTYFV